jgi:hypothetical protein
MGIINSYIKDILKLSIDNDYLVRIKAIKILRLIWTQGHTNPLEMIPTLVALMADRTQEVKASAYSILEDMYKKRPDLLKLRINEGLKLSFDFQMNNYE